MVSDMAMVQNDQPPKWMLFLLNMIIELWVIGTIILSHSHATPPCRGISTKLDQHTNPMPGMPGSQDEADEANRKYRIGYRRHEIGADVSLMFKRWNNGNTGKDLFQTMDVAVYFGQWFQTAKHQKVGIT